MKKFLKVLAGVVPAALILASTAVAAPGETTKYEIKAGEVVSTWDNHLVVKDMDGNLTHYDIPAGQKFSVDGKDVAISDLKPGTKLAAIIETKTKPYAVVQQTVKDATVVKARGDALLLKGEDGHVKQFIIPAGFRFHMVRGDMRTEQLKAGDKLNATFITKFEGTKTEKKAVIAGEAPKAPAAPAAAPAPAAPAPAAAAAPAPAPAAAPVVAEKKAKKLPKTGSPLPLAGLAGVLSLASGLALRARRSA